MRKKVFTLLFFTLTLRCFTLQSKKFFYWFSQWIIGNFKKKKYTSNLKSNTTSGRVNQRYQKSQELDRNYTPSLLKREVLWEAIFMFNCRVFLPVNIHENTELPLILSYKIVNSLDHSSSTYNSFWLITLGAFRGTYSFT